MSNIKPINIEKTILIPLEEYKELLMIKGRYKEIKENETIIKQEQVLDFPEFINCCKEEK